MVHSPFSPSSPISPLYPDGLIDARWICKHQELVPSVVISFYNLTMDQTRATLEDNKVKNDISNIRHALIQSGYKTRLVVVLLGDEGQRKSGADGVPERLENIRRGCGIDPKSFFFVPAVDSQDQLQRFAENALTTIYTQSLDYYRDLTKHVRKKRGRGVAPPPTVPPTSGTSQTLSLQGWNVRYDFKSGVFAEYRQEMDVAFRSYEQAYENLLSSEVAELVPNWSPRFNEARLLADVISIRTLRCLLWAGQSTAAVRRWQHHRDRILDLVERRGSGTNNYGWQAWEARWATVMANLLERAKLPDLAPATLNLYMSAEKGAMTTDKIRPWELLHHTGYWYRLAARHLNRRRSYAMAIPENDRRPPSASPASRVANKAFTYDTYMCPQPHEEYPLAGSKGVNHSQLIIDCLMKARSEFQKRQQLRLAAELTLECGREFKDAQNVVLLLEPLWRDMSFRTEGWLDVAEQLSWTLRDAASRAGRADLVTTIDWELMNQCKLQRSHFQEAPVLNCALGFSKRRDWHYDLSKSLDGVTNDSKPSVKIHDGNVISFLSTSFIFKNEEGKAGETAQAQLSITSSAHAGSAPITVDRLQVDFVGSIRGLVLNHVDGASSSSRKHKNTTVTRVTLEERSVEPKGNDASADLPIGTTSLYGDVDLTFAPGTTLVFSLDIPLREPGEANAASTRFFINQETFDLEYVAGFREHTTAVNWYTLANSKKHVSRTNAHTIRILPRPPKMEIKQLAVPEEFYTNEDVELQFEINNAEGEDASTKLHIVIRGDEAPPPFTLQVAGKEEQTEASVTADASEIHGLSLGTITTTSPTILTVKINPIAMPATYEITLHATYHLISDPATPITQHTTFPLSIVNPFEANYDLLPRLHPDPWPTLFNFESTAEDLANPSTAIPRGISQSWSLTTRYASFASADLVVHDLSINIIQPQHQPSSARIHTTRLSPEDLPSDGQNVQPKTIQETTFSLQAQKLSLDDRNPTPLDLTFQISWSRQPTPSNPFPTTNTTTLPVPRFSIFGLEPRVLASAVTVPSDPPLINLQITIENPSNHFLTFGLSLEPSEEFAFSGSKQTTVNCLPVSRREVKYRLVPLVRDQWVRLGLVVRDKYFQKVLRVVATEGMRGDKEGVMVWFGGEGGDEEGEGGN